MKSHEVIDSRMSDWHAVDAPTQARDSFGMLDSDEVIRLAMRAFTEEWRAALRSKDDFGVARYASLEVGRPDGSLVRVYKQTAMFSVADFEAVIAYHKQQAVIHLVTAQHLAQRCNAVHSTQLEIPGIAGSTA